MPRIEFEAAPMVSGAGTIRTVGEVPSTAQAKATLLDFIAKPVVVGFALGFVVAKLLK
jgi:hypothetical protein